MPSLPAPTLISYFDEWRSVGLVASGGYKKCPSGPWVEDPCTKALIKCIKNHYTLI